MNRSLPILMLASLLFSSATGCRSWPGFVSPWAQRQQDAPPVLFSTIPSREELVAAIGIPSGKVQSLQTQGATVSLAGLPSASADISLQRPGKFRFKASSTFVGQLADLGSNEEMLWFWNFQDKDSVFFGRHDRLAASGVQQRLAVDPSMFVEALGLVEISPDQVIGEPTTAGKDRLQLVCRQMTPAGEFTRTLLVHKKHGYLLEQRITDSAGRAVINARMSEHRHYALDGVTLPHTIDLHVPNGDMRVQLNVQRYSINQPFPNGEATFAFPRDQLGQYQMVDITDPSFVPPGQAPPAQYSSPGNAQPSYPQPGYPQQAYPPPGAAAPRTSQAQPYRGRLY